jgi:hypothetical protein
MHGGARYLNAELITGIVRPADSGMTSPFLCELENGGSYFVKGRGALAHGLISEVVVATLGKSFELPIPDFCIAQAPTALLDAVPGARASLGAGFCFASRAVEPLGEMPSSQLGRIGRQFQQRLFLFDYWVMNEDRTGVNGQGNPNLFLNLRTKTPVVFDHNLAFDPDFSFSRNREMHVCSNAWFEPSVDLIWPSTAKPVMLRALDALAGIENVLPEEWLEAAPGFLYQALTQLMRIESQDFWEPLK